MVLIQQLTVKIVSGKRAKAITNEITPTTAVVNWEFAGCCNNYTISKISGAGAVVENLSTRTHTLTGLTPNTRYDIVIEAMNEATPQECRILDSFTTLDGGKFLIAMFEQKRCLYIAILFLNL